MQKIGSVPFLESNLFAIVSIFCHFTLCNIPFQTDAMFRKVVSFQNDLKRLEDIVSTGFKTQLRGNLNVEIDDETANIFQTLPLKSIEDYKKFIQWLQEEADRVQIVVS